MPLTKGIVIFTVSFTMMFSSLRADPEAFSETGATYGTVTENTMRFGKLLIGAQGPVSDKEMGASALKSAGRSNEYQSKEEAFHLAKAKLQRLGPSVHCGNDSMILHISGPRMPHFLVDRGDRSPVRLSEMPASCGFSLKRARRDVSLVAPYQGCDVRQQGGSYILPLLVLGAPVQMSCPVSPRLPTVSCFPSGMTISLGLGANDVKVKVDGSWQPLLQTYSQCSFTLATVGGSLVITAPFTGRCWEITNTDVTLPLMYGDRELSLSCPVMQPMLAPTTIEPDVVQDPADGQQIFDPFPFGGPWGYPPGVRPVPPAVPPKTSQDNNQQMFPPMYPMSMFGPYYFHSKGIPAAPWVQQPRYLRYPSPPYMYPFKSPVKVTTTPSTTTAAQFEQFVGYPPMYPKLPGPQSIKNFVPPDVQYPFMPQIPQDPVFAPYGLNSGSSPAQSPSIYWSPRGRHWP